MEMMHRRAFTIREDYWCFDDYFIFYRNACYPGRDKPGIRRDVMIWDYSVDYFGAEMLLATEQVVVHTVFSWGLQHPGRE